MKALLVFLRVAAVGVALLAGGWALYRNRDKLKVEWKERGRLGDLREMGRRLWASRPVASMNSFRRSATRFAVRAR